MLYWSATVTILPKIPGIGTLMEIEIQVVGAYSVKAKEGCVLHAKSDAGFSLTQKWLSIAAVFICFSLSLMAQNTAGSITGVVQDSQGAVIPSAKVTALNQEERA